MWPYLLDTAAGDQRQAQGPRMRFEFTITSTEQTIFVGVVARKAADTKFSTAQPVNGAVGELRWGTTCQVTNPTQRPQKIMPIRRPGRARRPHARLPEYQQFVDSARWPCEIRRDCPRKFFPAANFATSRSGFDLRKQPHTGLAGGLRSDCTHRARTPAVLPLRRPRSNRPTQILANREQSLRLANPHSTQARLVSWLGSAAP